MRYLVRMTQDAAPDPGRVPPWTIGDRLRKARETNGMTQQQWADTIGISRGSVANYEAEKQDVKRPVLLAWAMASGVSLAWLRDGTEPTPNPVDPSTADEGTRRYASIHSLRTRLTGCEPGQLLAMAQ